VAPFQSLVATADRITGPAPGAMVACRNGEGRLSAPPPPDMRYAPPGALPAE